jgi:hypothetical protein
MVRPSASSTDKVSSLTLTREARASRLSTVEELIPTLQEMLSVLLDQLVDLIDFLSAETRTLFQSHGIEPELRLGVVAIDVNVWRLRTIARVEEKPKRSRPEYCRHVAMLPQPGAEDNVTHCEPGAQRTLPQPFTSLFSVGKSALDPKDPRLVTASGLD